MDDNECHLAQGTGDPAAAFWYRTWREGGPNTPDDPWDLIDLGSAHGELDCEGQQDHLPPNHLGQQQQQRAPSPAQVVAAPPAVPTAMPPPLPPCQQPLQLDMQQLQLLAQLFLAQQHAPLQQQPGQAPPLPLQHQQQQQVAPPLVQQWQQVEHLPHQQQQQPRAAVPPPDGPPSEQWLRDTARLLSRTEGDSKSSGLQRLGDMMWGLTAHLDAKGYELPTAFPKEVLRLPGPSASLLVTRGRAVGSRKTSGSLKSGPQPFRVAEGVYLANVYYPRCSCGRTRVKACAEEGHPYNNVYPFVLAFFEPGVPTCSWDSAAKQCGVPAPGCLKNHPLVYHSEPKPNSAGGLPTEDPRPSSKRKAYIDMWVSTKVMAYLSVMPEEQQREQQRLQEVQPSEQHQQQQGGPSQPPVLPQTQEPLPPHQALLQSPPHLETMLPLPLHMQQLQQQPQQQLELHQEQEPTQQQDGPQPIEAEASAAAAAATSPFGAWVPAHNRTWSFLLSCQHFGRPVLDGTGLAGSPPAAGGTRADAAGQSFSPQAAELLAPGRALLDEMQAAQQQGQEQQASLLQQPQQAPQPELQHPQHQAQPPPQQQQAEWLVAAPPLPLLPVPPPQQLAQSARPQGFIKRVPAWAPARNLIWAFLISCQQFGRQHVSPGADPPTSSACSCTAGTGQTADGSCAAGAGALSAAEAEVLSCWRALLAAVPPGHLLAMRADEAWDEERQGQCLAHWLVTPPDRLGDPFQKPIPTDPDAPLPESLAVQMVQAAMERLGPKRWRDLLRVGDAKHDATALHRACLFGHRLRVLQLMLKHAPRDALLCETGHFWLPYHSAFRRGHYQAGLMHLQEVVRLCAKLTGSSSGSGSTAAAAADTSYRDDPRQLLVFTLQNEHFCREDGGRPSGHQLVMRACGELGLGQPRVLPQEKWEVKIDAKAVAKFRAKLLVLDAAEALQGLGLTQVPSGVGREGEEAPGSKRPRGG